MNNETIGQQKSEIGKNSIPGYELKCSPRNTLLQQKNHRLLQQDYYRVQQTSKTSVTSSYDCSYNEEQTNKYVVKYPLVLLREACSKQW